MSDLVKREDVVIALLEKGQSSKRYKLGEIWELNFDEIRDAIAKVPIKEGEWSVRVVPSTLGYFEYTCSECGGKAYEATKYCGHCGSYMWGRKESG